MLILTEWVDRLAPVIRSVDLAVNVDAAQQVRSLPNVSVIPGREMVKTAPRSVGAADEHRVAAEVLVVTGVKRGNQPLGGPLVDQLRDLRQPMLQELIGWLPTGMDIEVAWQGGRLLSLTTAALFWVDAFKTEYWWTS